jgi:hypothetical protein
MVYGFVHQTYVADVIANLAISHSGWDRFSGLLSSILRDKLGIDLNVIQITDTTKPLWSEFNRLSAIRNHILHRGENTDDSSANSAIAVAEEFSGTILQKLLANFSLSLDSYGNIIDATNVE